MTSSQLSPSAGWWAYLIIACVVAAAAAARGVWSPCGLSMISAINPFSERARGHRYWLTAGWFVTGSVLGGALLGGAAAVGALVWSAVAGRPGPTAALAAGCCLIALVSDSTGFGFRLPSHPRQVNEQWLSRYRRWVYATGFGVQIGSGFATYIMTAAVYLVAVLGALSGSPSVALAVGVLFGLVRGLAVLLSSAVRDPAGLRRLHRRLDLLDPWSLRAVMLVQALAAVALGYLAAGLAGTAVVVATLSVGSRLASTRRAWTSQSGAACADDPVKRAEPAEPAAGVRS